MLFAVVRDASGGVEDDWRGRIVEAEVTSGPRKVVGGCGVDDAWWASWRRVRVDVLVAPDDGGADRNLNDRRHELEVVDHDEARLGRRGRAGRRDGDRRGR